MFFFLGPSLIFSSTNFFAAKVSSLRHQKPKKNVYTVHSKAADPRNSDRPEFLTTMEEDEKILCFVFLHTKCWVLHGSFCQYFLFGSGSIFFGIIFYSSQTSSKAMQLKLAIHCLLAPYFPMGKPPLASLQERRFLIGKIVGRKASLAQSGKLSRPRCPKSP